MAEYKSRFLELGFYVDGQLRNFRNGQFVTEDKAEIAVLDGLADTERVDVDEPKPKAEKPAAKSSAK
jgi:hypothetical protein